MFSTTSFAVEENTNITTNTSETTEIEALRTQLIRPFRLAIKQKNDKDSLQFLQQIQAYTTDNDPNLNKRLNKTLLLLDAATYYYNDNQPKKGIQLLLQAKQISKTLPEKIWKARLYKMLSLCYSESQICKYSLAEDQQKKAIALREKLQGKYHADTYESYLYLIDVYNEHYNSNPKKALELLEKLHQRIESSPTPSLLIFSKILASQGSIHLNLRHFDKAEKALLKSLKLKQELKLDEQEFYENHIYLAQVYQYSGRYYQGAHHYRKTIEIAYNNPNHSPSLSFANVEQNLGDCLSMLEQPRDVSRQYDTSLKLRQSLHGEKSYQATYTLMRMAEHYNDVGDFKKSDETFSRAISIRKKLKAKAGEAELYNMLANALTWRNDYEGAYKAQQESMSIIAELHGKKSWQYASELNDMASYLVSNSQHERAKKLNMEALSIWTTTKKKPVAPYSSTLINLAFHKGREGKLLEKQKLLEKALQLRSSAFVPTHPYVFRAQSKLLTHYCDNGELKKAEKIGLNYLNKAKQSLGSQHPKVIQALQQMARISNQRGQFSLGINYMEKALTSQEKNLGAQHPTLAESLGSIGSMQNKLGQFDKADESFQQALSIWVIALGLDTPEGRDGLGAFKAIYNKNGKLVGLESQLREHHNLPKGDAAEDAKPLARFNLIYSQRERLHALETHLSSSLKLRQNGLTQSTLPQAQTYYLQALLAVLQDKYEEAPSPLNQAIKILDKLPPDSRLMPLLSNVVGLRARLYCSNGEHQQAIIYLEKSLSLCQQSYGKDAKLTLSAQKNLDTVKKIISAKTK